MNILVTGGAGYIGSHTCVELLNDGHDVIVVDNLLNSNEESLKRIKKITGKTPVFFCTDVQNIKVLEDIFASNKIDAVIHFAGLKAVGESMQIPLEYYNNNLNATFVLCKTMKKYNVFNLVFSSSATVYGDPETVPITEDFPLSATNPYGWSKLMIEQILKDIYIADSSWNIARLRYFNPVGAHESGLIGEDPSGIPNNLMPYISQVAVGKLQYLSIFGNDYQTCDGTGVRDYIHVTDLAIGHLFAIKKLMTSSGLVTYNLGTGKGYSVLEMIVAFEKASNKKIPYKIAKRRLGDIAQCYADSTKANIELGWKARRDLEKMAVDTWRWQKNNPEGF